MTRSFNSSFNSSREALNAMYGHCEWLRIVGGAEAVRSYIDEAAVDWIQVYNWVVDIEGSVNRIVMLVPKARNV